MERFRTTQWGGPRAYGINKLAMGCTRGSYLAFNVANSSANIIILCKNSVVGISIVLLHNKNWSHHQQ